MRSTVINQQPWGPDRYAKRLPERVGASVTFQVAPVVNVPDGGHHRYVTRTDRPYFDVIDR